MRLKLQALVALTVVTAMFGGVALAAARPSAHTGGTSSVTDTSATLHGTVNPNGASTYYYFVWGRTTAYGSRGPTRSAGGGTTTVLVQESADQLTPGATYHYRLIASNSSGTSLGADRTFTAGRPSPTVTTGAATQLSSAGTILTGTVNPNGESTSWYFEWGTLQSLSQQTAPQTLRPGTTPQSVSWSLQGLLSAGTVYQYRLVATHAKGVKSYGDTAIFMTYPAVRPYSHVTQTTRPHHAHSRPYVFTTTGTVRGPDWIPAQFACRGQVTIRFYRGHHQVRYMTAPVRSNCSFSRQTVFNHAPGGRTPVQLRVVVHFVSTNYLARNHGTTRYVTLG